MSSREFARWSPPGSELGSQITSLNDFSPDVLGQLRAYFEQSGPKVPVVQQPGQPGFLAVTADGHGNLGTTAQTAYADLDADSGPAGSVHAPYITNPPVGRWIFAYGGIASNSAATNSNSMALSYNGVIYQGPVGARSDIFTSGVENVGMIGFATIDITDATVILKTQYKVSAGTGTFNRRFLVGLKTANLTT